MAGVGNFVNTNHIRAADPDGDERVEWKHSREGEKTERIRED